MEAGFVRTACLAVRIDIQVKQIALNSFEFDQVSSL